MSHPAGQITDSLKGSRLLLGRWSDARVEAENVEQECALPAVDAASFEAGNVEQECATPASNARPCVTGLATDMP